MQKPGKIGYNEAWIKKAGRDKALKVLKEAHPDYDHTAIVDKIHPPKRKED